MIDTTERLRARLAELRSDLDVGERRLQALEMEKAQLRDTLLRIAGAVQVLEEILGEQAESVVAEVDGVTRP